MVVAAGLQRRLDPGNDMMAIRKHVAADFAAILEIVNDAADAYHRVLSAEPIHRPLER
jgi:hypothetical protein